MKNKKIYLILLLILISIITIVVFVTRSKYSLNKQTVHTQNSEMFYLESDLLAVDGIEKMYNNWNGNSEYKMNFLVKNYEDEIRVNSLETNYTITPTIISQNGNTNVTISTSINGIDTNLGQLQGNIKKDDNIEIVINPNGGQFSEVIFKIELTSTSPYEKILMGNFKLLKKDFNTYQTNLQDTVNQEYAKLLIRTDDYEGNIRIYYNKLLSEPDMASELLQGISKQSYSEYIYYIDVNLDKNSNYQIDFIKKDITEILTLGDSIENSSIYIQTP